MDLAQEFDLLLGDFEHLAPRIRNLRYNTDACGERIDVRCSYIAFRDGIPTFDEFIEVIADHIISFCLPRKEIRKALADAQVDPKNHVRIARVMNRLNEKARGLFIKAQKGSHRSGEAGEILLYLLTEWLLKAPQIVSKMYLKTNSQMPVHGTDGIHARFDAATNKLYLFWGESKAHVKIGSALSSALDSIHEFIKEAHDKREIAIVGNFADFDEMDAPFVEALLKYLDPYEEVSNERVITHSCLLVFEHPVPKNAAPEKAETAFVESINETVRSFVGSIQKTVTDKGLGPQRFEFFLVPVPSVQQFRDKFQARIGWPAK